MRALVLWRVLALCLAIALLPMCAVAQWTSPFAVPPAPTGVWVIPGSNNNIIRWNRVPGASSYYIYKGTSSGAEGAVAIGSTSTFDFTDTAAENGTTYYYKIAATYSSTPGALSAEASGQPGSASLQAPLVSAKPTPTGVALAFSISPGATFYDIFRYSSADGYQRVGHVLGEANTNFADNTAVLGTTYQYVVRAGSDLGVGTESLEAYGAAGDAPAAAPSGIWVNPESSGVTVNWNSVPGATGYILYRGTTTGGETNRPFLKTSNSSSMLVSGTNGTSYYFKVAAVDNSGVGEMSSEAVGTAGATKPDAPQLAGNAGPSSISIRWSAIPGASLYRLFRADDNGYYVQIKTIASTIFSATDTAVVPGAPYTYYVAASTPDGTGDTNSIKLRAGVGKPSAPSQIAAYPSGNYNFIYWNPVSGANSYNIYRGTASGAEALISVNNSSPYYNDYAVAPGTRYYYQVRAVAYGPESNFSAEVSVKAGQLRLPARTSALKSNGGQLQVVIGTVPGATSYDILRSQDNGSNYFLLATGVTSATYTDASASPYGSYIYRVAGVNSDGEGVFGNYLYGVAGNPVVPPPTGTIAFAYSTYINVQCAYSPVGVTYNLYRSTTTTMPSVPMAENTSESFNDYTAVPGVRYYYAFVAVDNEGESAFSPLCSAKVGASVLAAPTATLNQASSTSLLLNWTPVSGSTGYDVFRADNNSDFQMISQNLPAPTLTDTGLTPGVQYTYYINAVGADGAGSRSNSVSGVPGSTRLATPFGLTVQAAGSGTTYLSWNTVEGTSTYNIYRGTSAGGEGLIPVALGVYGSSVYGSYYDYGLVDGVKYYYKITAVDFHGQSLLSTEASARVNSARLTGPTASITAGATMLTINWTAVAGAASYTVFRQISGLYGYQVVKIGTTGTSFNDATVIPGATYQYYVCASNSNGLGYTSNVVSGATP